MPITLPQLSRETAQHVESGRVQFIPTLQRSRAEGHPVTDFATGTLDAVLELAEGKFTLRIRWQAEGQNCVEDGWICRFAPELSGGGVFSDVAILDEEGVVLAADSDELTDLAYDTFSYLGIEDIVAPLLPARPEPSVPEPGFDPFSLKPGKAKRRGRR